MDILVATPQLKDLFNNTRALQSGYGDDRAKKVRRRLDDLRAATSLQDIYRMPGRLHELKGNRKGQLSIVVAGALRIILEPANEPVPTRADGGLDWSRVTQVRILEIVEDYHEEKFMMLKNEYMPDEVSVPGESLADILEERGMSQAELARRVGHAEKTISEIIHGKAPITPEMAVKLETVLGVPARFWNMRQAQYQDWVAREQQGQELREYVEWINQFPYAQMVKWGWIASCKTPLDRLRELLRFFGFASPREYDLYWRGFWSTAQVSLRTSPTFANVQNALAAWLRQGEIEAQRIECAPYNEQTFRRALQSIRNLTTKEPSTYAGEAVRSCAEAGVAVVFVPELTGMRVSGAARWLTPDKALIQVCLRYKTDDQLWFTFFHEAGHILLDGKRQIFVDTGVGEEDEKELRANKFAADILIPPDKLRRFLATDRGRNLSTRDIERFAHELTIAPGIVVGRLQHDGVVSFKNHNGLKKRLQWEVTD